MSPCQLCTRSHMPFPVWIQCKNLFYSDPSAYPGARGVFPKSQPDLGTLLLKIFLWLALTFWVKPKLLGSGVAFLNPASLISVTPPSFLKSPAMPPSAQRELISSRSFLSLGPWLPSGCPPILQH